MLHYTSRVSKVLRPANLYVLSQTWVADIKVRMFPLTMHGNWGAKELNFFYSEDNLEQVGFNSVLKAKAGKQHGYACMIIFEIFLHCQVRNEEVLLSLVLWLLFVFPKGSLVISTFIIQELWYLNIPSKCALLCLVKGKDEKERTSMHFFGMSYSSFPKICQVRSLS